jgi:hypothetical protein
LVLSFLNGDLTVRFLLKAGVIAALAGGVVWWLQQNLHGVPGQTGGKRMLWYALCAAALAVVAVSAWVTGGPLQARLRTQDAERVNDLRAIYRAVSTFHREQGRLPATLEECNTNPGTFIQTLQDPVSGEPYGYRLNGDNAFVLEATFALPSRGSSSEGDYSDPRRDGFWQHPAGRTTYQIDLGTRRTTPP